MKACREDNKHTIRLNSNILTTVSFSPVARPIRDCRPSTVKGQTLQSEENLYLLTKYEDTLPFKYKIRNDLHCEKKKKNVLSYMYAQQTLKLAIHPRRQIKVFRLPGRGSRLY